ncbi:hypothetical protein [Sphingomonas sp.]
MQDYAAVVGQAVCGLPFTVFLRVRLQSHGGDVARAFEACVRELEEVLD